MANDTTLNTPVVWINKYLQSKLQDVGFSAIPFFPTQPSTIESLTQGAIISDSGAMATYDRMFRMNRKSFPHIKSEQLLYYFYTTNENRVESMVKIIEEIYRLLDRGDESAEEVNNWCSNRRVDLGNEEGAVDNMFYFHNFKVFHLEEVRDIVDFATARTFAANKIIIDFDYHQMPDLTNNDWSPEAPLVGDNKITI